MCVSGGPGCRTGAEEGRDGGKKGKERNRRAHPLKSYTPFPQSPPPPGVSASVRARVPQGRLTSYHQSHNTLKHNKKTQLILTWTCSSFWSHNHRLIDSRCCLGQVQNTSVSPAYVMLRFALCALPCVCCLPCYACPLWHHCQEGKRDIGGKGGGYAPKEEGRDILLWERHRDESEVDLPKRVTKKVTKNV